MFDDPFFKVRKMVKLEWTCKFIVICQIFALQVLEIWKVIEKTSEKSKSSLEFSLFHCTLIFQLIGVIWDSFNFTNLLCKCICCLGQLLMFSLLDLWQFNKPWLSYFLLLHLAWHFPLLLPEIWTTSKLSGRLMNWSLGGLYAFKKILKSFSIFLLFFNNPCVY